MFSLKWFQLPRMVIGVELYLRFVPQGEVFPDSITIPCAEDSYPVSNGANENLSNAYSSFNLYKEFLTITQKKT